MGTKGRKNKDGDKMVEPAPPQNVTLTEGERDYEGDFAVLQVDDSVIYIDQEGNEHSASIMLKHDGMRLDLLVKPAGSESYTAPTVQPGTGADGETNVWFYKA